MAIMKSPQEFQSLKPVIKKGNVHISLENGVHRIEAETSQEEKEDKEGKVIHQERRYGKYVRSFDLGNSVTPRGHQGRLRRGHIEANSTQSCRRRSPATTD
ncbi:MAG TPA: Hsp20 family protein [Porticoccus sp.]|nr:Hsp20 family protein [Porticoccus sp.]